MAGPYMGDAIFSTELGRFPPREAGVMPPRIILRSVPEEDMEAMVEDLRTKFPVQCASMQAPITNVHDYFDIYDQQLHGQMFLHAVLTEICFRNLRRRKAVLHYAETWIHLNSAAFDQIHQYGLDAFTEDDVKEYGDSFLQEVLQDLQLRKPKQNGTGQWSAPTCISISADPIAHPKLVILASEKSYERTQERIQHINTTNPFAIWPHLEQTSMTGGERNPTAFGSSPATFAPPQSIPANSSSNMGPAQALMPHLPNRRPQPLVDNTSARPLEPPLRSAPTYNSYRAQQNINRGNSGMDAPRSSFSDTFFGPPPPDQMSDPVSFQRASAEPRALPYTGNKSRTLPKTRPFYVGPSNDARVLEKQGVPRNRSSFGDGRMNRSLQQTFDQQVPYPKMHSRHPQSNFYGAPPERCHDNGTLSIGASNVANRHGTFEIDRPPVIAEQDSFTSNPYDMAGTLSNDPHNVYGQPQAGPHQIFGTPSRYRRGTFHEPQITKPADFLNLTPPPAIQQGLGALPPDSATLPRFSNVSYQPSEATPKAYDTGNYQSTPGSHHSRGPNLGKSTAVSDRRVWVGGLLPEAKVEDIAQILEPWGPVRLDKIIVPKTVKNKQGTHNAFTFAEFDSPPKATGAITALNEQYKDLIKSKLFLKPAYIRPAFDRSDGSPQKSNPRTNRHFDSQDGPIDRSSEDRKRASSLTSQVYAQAPIPISSKPSNWVSHKRDQLSAEWPALGKSTAHSGLDSLFPNDQISGTIQDVHNTTDTQGRGAPLRVSDPNETQTAITDDTTGLHNSAAARITSTTPEAIEHKTASSPASKTSSPVKKKDRYVNRDEVAAGKTPQAKQRKEMLSSLRTEKLNTTASKSVVRAPSSINHHLIGNENIPLHDPGAVIDELDIPLLGLYGDGAEAVFSAQVNMSKEQVSSADSTSMHERRPSSASIMVSTGATSYAQSESSENGMSKIQSSFSQVTNDLPPPVQQAPSSSLALSSSAMGLANATKPQPLTNKPTSEPASSAAVHMNKDQRSRIASVNSSDSTPSEVPPQCPATTISNKSSAAQSESNIGKACRQDLEPKDFGERTETPKKGSGPTKISAGDHEVSYVSSLEAPTVSPQAESLIVQAQPLSSPSTKRIHLKDPKILVAVPKLLPLMRQKPHSWEPSTHVSKSPSSFTASSGSLNDHESDDAGKAPQTSSSPGVADAVSASAGKVGEQQVSESLAGAPSNAEPMAVNDTDQVSDVVEDAQVESESYTASSEYSLAAKLVTMIEDDRLDPDTSTPQSFAAAMIDLAKDVQPSAEQQPIIQQKKPKTKKGKKKSKKLKNPQADLADGNSKTQIESNAAEPKAEISRTVQVETPFLSDDKQPLPRPAFARQNHSSMRSRFGPQGKNQQLDPSPNSQPTTFWIITPTKGAGEPDTTESQDETPPKPSFDKNNVQSTSSPARGIESPSMESGSLHAAVEETREDRLNVLGKFIKENNLAPEHQIFDLLHQIAPEQPVDVMNEVSSSSQSQISNDYYGLEEARVEEIMSDNDMPISPSSTTRLEHRQQDVLPSQDVSPAPLVINDSSTTTGEPGKGSQDEQGDDAVGTNEQIAVPSPPTGAITPGYGSESQSVSPVPGLGLFVDGQSLTGLENVIPSRSEPRKTLSYKQVASTPPIQPGDIVEIIPKEVGPDGKDGQGVTVVRKTDGKDPWRVPSSEQPWGGTNKTKSTSPIETSEMWK
ncbi:MAG: hypothetical protein Q9219_002129 [cf. Caloplaca sp. 3 TL-2023]